MLSLNELYNKFFQEAIGEIKGILTPDELSLNRENSPSLLLQVVEEKLRNDQFYLAVLGQFKRGKSTFINALLEEGLLPTGVIPLTSVVTVLHYGPETLIQVIYRDQRTEEVSRERLFDIITEKGNPGNELKVDYVKIAYPSPFLEQGLVLADTPGVGSLQKANTTETLAYLPRIDAAVFLLSADQPLNTEEVNFLRQSSQIIPHLFFVLNKMDLVRPEELRESLDYCQTMLEKDFPSTKIYPVSSRQSLEGSSEQSGILLLKQEIEEFLHQKGQAIELQGNVGRIHRVITQLKETDNLQKKAYLLSEQELANSLQKFKELEVKVREVKEDFKHILYGESQSVLQYLTQQVEQFRLEKSHQLSREIYGRFHEKAEIEEIESFALQRLIEILEAWRPELTEVVAVRTRNLLQRLDRQAREIAQNISKAGGEVLRTEVSLQLPEPRLTQKSSLEYFVEKEIGLIPFGLENLLSPFPWSVRKGITLNKVTERMERLLDRNCGRIRVDVSERLAITTQEFFRVWEDELERIIRIIRLAIDHGIRLKQDEAAHGLWQSKIQQREEVFQKIQEKLEGILEGLDKVKRFD